MLTFNLIYEKTTIFNIKLISVHKHLMCSEGTMVVVRLPENSVNIQ